MSPPAGSTRPAPQSTDDPTAIGPIAAGGLNCGAYPGTLKHFAPRQVLSESPNLMHQPASLDDGFSAIARSAGVVPMQPSTPRDSLAFFTALNACGRARGAQLHPICARNCGVLAAWTALESKFLESPLSVIGRVSRNYEDNLRLLGESVARDPLWQQGRINVGNDPRNIEATLAQATAPMMFWARRNALIEPTDALERILVDSDLGEDLPATLFRPPVPACFIRFGTAFQEAVVPAPARPDFGAHILQGAYVFESVRTEQRALTLVPIYLMREPARFAAGRIEMIIGDETDSLEQIVRTICERAGGEQGEHLESVARIVTKVFLYMGLGQATQVEQRDYSAARERLGRLGPKKAARLQRQIADLYDRIVLGPQQIHLHGHGEVSPHLRRGHFRMQPHGPQMSLRKLMFIAPTWVRADKLAAGG